MNCDISKSEGLVLVTRYFPFSSCVKTSSVIRRLTISSSVLFELTSIKAVISLKVRNFFSELWILATYLIDDIYHEVYVVHGAMSTSKR